MPKVARMFAIMRAEKQIIAEIMSKKTPYIITANMVNYVKGEESMNVYSAQYGDVTILCWVRPNGEYSVKTVSW